MAKYEFYIRKTWDHDQKLCEHQLQTLQRYHFIDSFDFDETRGEEQCLRVVFDDAYNPNLRTAWLDVKIPKASTLEMCQRIGAYLVNQCVIAKSETLAPVCDYFYPGPEPRHPHIIHRHQFSAFESKEAWEETVRVRGSSKVELARAT